MKTQSNNPKDAQNQTDASRQKYQKPVITRHGNLKKITALSFQPPE